MKRLLFGISLLIYTITGLHAQSSTGGVEVSPRVATLGGLNFTEGVPSIRTIIPLSETAYYWEPVAGFHMDEIMDEIQYFDGLGRPMQIVQRAMSPESYVPFEGAGFREQKALVIHQEYDAFGRKSTGWLPTVSSYAGALIPLDILKENAKNQYQDSAYSRPVYEASPLSRVTEQYGPGKRWYNSGKSVKTEYLTNKGTAGELSCIWFEVDGRGMNTTLNKKGYYSDAQLLVTKITTEEASVSYEFKDKLGQVLLTRQINDKAEYLDTYYVYDDYSNLCFVVPPITSEIATKGNLSSENLDLYGYQYKYDDYKRCIQKKLPGAKHISYIYDKADRLIFTQDGEQRTDNEWLFSLSDTFGRSVLTGICKNADITHEKYQDLLVEAEAKDGGTYNGYNLLVNGEKTSLTGVKLLTVNYYDNYNFLGKYTIPNWQFTPKDGYGVRFTGDKGYETKGLLTGASVAVLDVDGSDTFLHSVSYYDNRGRVVQTIAGNHLEGEDKNWFAYTYTDWVSQLYHEHTAKGKDTQTELYTHTYDRTGRLTQTDYKLNDLSPIVLAENKYNKLGQLESSTPAGASNLKTAYKYNIRSWTEAITNNHFKQELDYDFSGNIHKMAWEQNARNRSYTFEYDKISRLTGAVYKGAANEDFSTSYIYDAHGNIQFLKRNGLKDDQRPGLIDDLEFKYIGNQMRSVKDHADPVMASASADIKNYSDLDTEFLYNANGAMKQDLNKGIQDIAYNYLNLPNELFIENDNIKAKNTYTYTADGSKLKVVHESDPKQKEAPVSGTTGANGEYSQIHTMDYVGNMIYEEGSLKRILLSNGYYDNEDKKFYFYISDHLGNNRIVADASGTVIQSNQYYPFGMAFAESTTAEQSSQPYKYNGKELDDTHGLNWYDYSTRFYDPGYITTPTPDAHSENYYNWSPYVYVGNNPMKYIDPLGTDTTHFEFNTGRIQAVNPGGEHVMSTILPEVTVKGQNPWRYGEEGGVYKLSNKDRGITLTLGEKPLNMVNIEFDILLMGRLFVNAVSSVAASAVAENTVQKGSIEITKKTFGHTFERHGESATNFLLKRAEGSGMAQGQFLNNQKAAEFILDNVGKTANGAVNIPIPKGFPARVIMPDGAFQSATHIRLIPGGSGVKTAYPLIP
ncbi:RHS repeat-associated core domain-containing protein [Dysgonomonas sp. HDW5B]|uniref:DUF6443 domain-containing protein n=1 Tax=Dysgonomonas sp. HDW5B TaxID=2714927 RepID=UPI0014093309|nr:DUF6443 domain-containing protein [Dysgonomonas sp. HDW5B]QIK54263.1 RHS repeat-associated core domain-containing protein [Dysgonomonas sp. HDW5B]